MRHFATFCSQYFMDEDRGLMESGDFGGKTLCEHLISELRRSCFECTDTDLDDFA